MWIADYKEGLHVGLVCERGGHDFVEYGFGEWEWYALRNDDWYRVMPALFWPTRGTLGRRCLRCATEAELREQLWYANLQEVEVDRGDLDRLLAELDELYRKGGTPMRNPDHALEFEPSADSYHLFHMCCDAAAGWLRRLRCKVSFSLVRTGLRTGAKPALHPASE